MHCRDLLPLQHLTTAFVRPLALEGTVIPHRELSGKTLRSSLRSPFLVPRRPEAYRRLVQSVFMKAATIIALSISILVQAQTPGRTGTPGKVPLPRTNAVHTAAVGQHPSLLNPASLKIKAPAIFKAKFTTTAGDFVVEVHRDWAPLGADRFYNLVRYGYFTNAAFFRVIPGFVAQFGLSANPAINKVWHVAKIQDDPVLQSNKRGRIVFATAGPNTRTTQLFINYADNGRLDGAGFAPFGTVVSGMDVVDKMFANYGESPRQDLIIDQGDAYLKAHFPDMDKIKIARVLPADPHAQRGTQPAAKPSSAKAIPKRAQH
jgi:peptidyl-prolyl cis-trans isomerase A (cyclophilin A)